MILQTSVDRSGPAALCIDCSSLAGLADLFQHLSVTICADQIKELPVLDC